MQINLLNIFANGENDYLLNCELEQDYVVIDGDFKYFTKPLSVNGVITMLGKDEYRFRADLAFSYGTLCDRCAKDVIEDVEFSIDKEINIDVDEEEYLQGSVLDIDDLVFEEVYLNLPVKTLCDDECKGLCPNCGADLNQITCDCEDDNIDPRLANLKELFKEV